MTPVLRMVWGHGRTWALAVALAAAVRAPAQDPQAAFAESWRWRVFDRREGLSSSSVSALHQDRQEYIYAATERGVCRYDLWEWSVLDNAQAFDDGEIVRFVESPNTLLAVTANALWRVQGGSTLALFHRGGGLHAAANDLGDIFVIDSRAQAHLHVRGEALERLDDVRLPSGRVHGYDIDASRNHWLATSDGLFVRDAGRRAWREFEDRDLDAELARQRCVRLLRVAGEPPAAGERPGGAAGWHLWAVFVDPRSPDAAQRIARLENGTWTAMGSLAGPLLGQITRTATGDFVATAEDGRLLHSPDGREWEFIANLGIGRSALQGGLLDSAGFLWFRHSAGGVAAFDARSRAWESIPTGSSDLFPRVYSVLETEDGSIWMGLARGVARSSPQRPPELWESVQGLALEKITGLAADRLGRVWISSAESFSGTLHFDPDAAGWARENGPQSPSHRVRRIVTDRAGELWFLASEPALDGGYTVYRLALSTSYEPSPVSVPHGPVNDLVRAQDETFWLATEEGLLETTLVEGRFAPARRWTRKEGLLSLQVWAVTEGSDGAIWVCYPSSGGGVTRILDGEVRSFQEVDGLASPDVWSILAAGQSLWFGTGRGLSRFDGECWYSYPIASLEFKSIRVWPLVWSRREPDCLVVGTFGQGAYKFRLDDRRRPRFASSGLETTAHRNGDVELEWDARDYRNETPRDGLVYRSRLDGGGWSRFANDRTLELKGLAPGRHTLEIEARDLAGNRNREELLHVFEVPAGVWTLGRADRLATTAAALLAAALAGLTVWWLLRRARRRGGARSHRDLFHCWPNAVLIIDEGGRVMDWNGVESGALGVKGVSRRDVVGRPAALLPVFFTAGGRALLDALLSGQAAASARIRLPDRDGEAACVDLTGFRLERARPRLVIALADATATVERERAADRDRRLASWRRLARMLAADLVPALKAAASQQPSGDDTAERLRRLDEAACLLADDGRAGTGAPQEPVDVHGAIERVLDRSTGAEGRVVLPGGIAVDYRGQPGLWSVVVATRRLEVALAAVLRRAVEDMGGNGTLTVRTQNLRLHEPRGALPAGRYVEISIKDTGEGMEVELLQEELEPFGPARPNADPSRIESSLVYGIVRAAGGDLWLQSAPGKGSRIGLVLPAVLDA